MLAKLSPTLQFLPLYDGDGGKNWTNVIGNVKGLAKASWVSSIRTSKVAGEAYVGFTGDFAGTNRANPAGFR